jgi:hypothetical protein
MAEEKERGTAPGLIIGGMGGAMLGAIATLLLTRPAKAAPPDEKLNYLIDVLTALAQVLAEVVEGQASLIQLLQQWLAAQGVAPPGMEVTVLTPWLAKEPEEIFKQDIRSTGTFYSDKMVDWRRGKRIYFFIESTLNQDVQIQVIGNKTDNKEGATDIGPAQICPASNNISIGPSWEQWCPFIGVKIVVGAAPSSGLLTTTVVPQE